jgi:hypothetical protein
MGSAKTLLELCFLHRSTTWTAWKGLLVQSGASNTSENRLYISKISAEHPVVKVQFSRVPLQLVLASSSSSSSSSTRGSATPLRNQHCSIERPQAAAAQL